MIGEILNTVGILVGRQVGSGRFRDGEQLPVPGGEFSIDRLMINHGPVFEGECVYQEVTVLTSVQKDGKFEVERRQEKRQYYERIFEGMTGRVRMIYFPGSNGVEVEIEKNGDREKSRFVWRPMESVPWNRVDAIQVSKQRKKFVEKGDIPGLGVWINVVENQLFIHCQTDPNRVENPHEVRYI